MKRCLYIQGDDPPFEHPSDDDQCPRLTTCGQPKNMKNDDALDSLDCLTYSLRYFSLSFPNFISYPLMSHSFSYIPVCSYGCI